MKSTYLQKFLTLLFFILLSFILLNHHFIFHLASIYLLQNYSLFYHLYMEKYKITKTLGDGAFGTVYKATNTLTGQIVAIKKFKQKYKNWDDCVELRQVKSLRKLNHKNIIKLKEVLQVSDQLYLVFQCLEYNLYELYSKCKQNKKKLTENEIKNIIYQVVSALACMHKNGFFHRDMKPQNLLIYNNIVKICDFGLAKEIRSRPPYTQYVSTRWYRAPQLLLRSTNYNSPVDIFALGCIMAELYMQTPLFAGTSELQQLNKIVKVLGTPQKNIWPEGYKLASNKGYYFPQQKKMNFQDMIPDACPEAIDLIESMLQYQSRKRPTAIQILKHPYFNNYIGLSDEIQDKKQIVFERKPDGKPIDTKKLDKNLQFKSTKQRFNIKKEVITNNQASEEDLDSILKELEQKQNKKSNKLPMISTKQNFNKSQKKELRQSKTQMSQHSNHHSFKIPIQQIKLMKYQYKNKEEPNNKIPIKKQLATDLFLNKLSYSFQPSLSELQPIPVPKYGRPLASNNNLNGIRTNVFKQRDSIFANNPLKAKSEMHYGYKF